MAKKMERDLFHSRYGAYFEMIYLLSNANPLKFKEVENMDALSFLCYSDYMLQKNRCQ